MGQVRGWGHPPRQLFRPPQDPEGQKLQETVPAGHAHRTAPAGGTASTSASGSPRVGRKVCFPLRPPAPQTARKAWLWPLELCLGAPELNFLTSAQIGWGGGDGQDMGGGVGLSEKCIWHPTEPAPLPSVSRRPARHDLDLRSAFLMGSSQGAFLNYLYDGGGDVATQGNVIVSHFQLPRWAPGLSQHWGLQPARSAGGTRRGGQCAGP